MSGPIIRSGATPEFSKNWEKIFGGAKKSSGKTAAKPVKKAAKKAPSTKAKKAPVKAGKKKS